MNRSTHTLLYAAAISTLLGFSVQCMEKTDSLQKEQQETDSVASVAFSPADETVLTGSGDKTACLRDVETEKEVRIFIGHTLGVASVAFSPDGKTIRTNLGNKSLEGLYSLDGKTVRTPLDDTNYLWDGGTK